jgi:hypothetical protein
VSVAKVVLGLYLVAQVVLGLVRVYRDVDPDDAQEMTACGIATVALGVVYGGLFLALAYA